MWYFVMTESIVTSHQRIVEEIGDDVISGEIANYLNKPYNYILYKYFASIGKATFKFFLTFIVGAIVVIIFLGGIKIEIYSIPFILLIVFLAITLHFTMMALLGLFAFWIEDPRSLTFVYSKIVFTIGGMLIPLEFFPDWLSKISQYLPFSYVAYYPSKLFVSFSISSFIQIFIVELIWIGLFIGIIKLFYNNHCKRLSVNGG
jgi:ABC-2 type transport system permease protein